MLRPCQGVLYVELIRSGEFRMAGLSVGSPAAVLIMQEARKLTMVQKITMHVPHAVLTALEHKGRYWLAPSRLLRYQALLLEQDDITLEKSTVLNPASLMPTDKKNDSNLDCLQVIEQAYASRPDPRDAPLQTPAEELYILMEAVVLRRG